jgi:hypothetical protein
MKISLCGVSSWTVMKIKRHPLASALTGLQLLVNSYSVSCTLSRGRGNTHTCCVTEKGISWGIESAYPYSLISGLESLMLVRIPSERARGL